MPDISRLPIRLTCEVGLDLVSPVDRMKPGAYPLLQNVRCLEEGRLDGRPGYTPYSTSGGPNLLHSIRRLNDPDQSVAATGFTDIVGNGTQLWAGQPNALAEIDSGYSGNPLSIIPFRPDVSVESWAYIYDANKQSKVNSANAVRAVGVAPPNAAPAAEYGIPAWVQVADGQSDSSWTYSGAATALNNGDRTSGASNTIGGIIYNSGTTGWCCLYPNSVSSGDYSWAGERMQVVINSGGGTQETVVVREIHPVIATTTIQAIQYDSGSTGPCSVVLTGNPAGLARNSLVVFGGELIRVLSVNASPDGTAYSIRCSTTGNHVAGATVTGAPSWYIFTVNNHVATETLTTLFIYATQGAAGTGKMQLLTVENAGVASGRPIDPANDYLHISLFIGTPANLVSVTLLIDVDEGTSTGGTPFTLNYYSWTLTSADLSLSEGTGSGVWADVSVPLSSAVRTGNDQSRNLTTIEAVGLTCISTGACNFGFDWWYNFGTYGAVIQPNAPTGYTYVSTFRDSSTGAFSVPGPFNRYSLNPLREDVVVTPATTAVAGIDYCDIYREGGTITDYDYVGSVLNNNGNPNSLNDGLSDETAASNSTADLTQLQPWPVLGIPWTGVCNVVGTTVEWVSGTPFNTALVNNSVILINGVAYETYGHPHSASFLEILLDAGALTNAAFSIQSPTLAGQPLPIAFGPLEGPFVPVVFAVGDPINAGTLYFSNPGNFDSASDQNTLDLCGPSDPLITGETWNGLIFAGSRNDVYVARYSFLTALEPGSAPYQFQRIPSPSGFWSPWAICRGPDGVYALGRDGIYRWTDAGGISITDEQLYPLFPHDGQPGGEISADYAPVDMTQTSFMRLSCLDNEIRFTYLDTNGVQNTLRYECAKKRWFSHIYADQICCEYLTEGLANSPNTMQILQLSRTGGLIYQAGGDNDNGVDIQSVVKTAAFDGGDERITKLPTDWVVDADQSGTVTATQLYNNQTVAGPSMPFTVNGPRTQNILNISQVAATLNSYRNISVKLQWAGGPDGPRLYLGELAWYPQPFLSTRVITQFFGLGFAAWKSHRRLFPGLISTTPVTFTITTVDGRTFQVTVPSTSGQFNIVPQMIPQCAKALAFAYELQSVDGVTPFALFTEEFTAEVKSWNEDSYINLAIFRA